MRKAASTISLLIFMFSALLLNSSHAQMQLNVTLERCVKMTRENNEQVLKAMQDLAVAEGILTTARSDEYLQMNFTSWYQRSKTEGDFETKDYSGTLSAEQLLLRFGAVPRKLDEAQEQYRRAELDLQSAEIDAVSKTRQIFYDIILINEEIAEREELRKKIDLKLKRTEDRVAKKIALELDLLDVQLELAQQDLNINNLRRSLRVKKTELLQAIGADEESEVVVSEELADEELNLDSSIRAALEHRVELKDIRGQIERQKRIEREAMWEMLPQLEASYRYKDASLILRQQDKTWDSLLAYEKPIWEKNEMEEANKDKWAFSLGLGFPIFDGFRVKGLVETEKARTEKLRIELLQKEKQIRLEVKRAFQDIADSKENMEILARIVVFREKTLERMEAITLNPVISQKYPHLAGITFDDVINARENYTEAQKNYFSQKRNYMLARENLRQKMGVIE